VLFNKSLPPNK
jgi:hypothetical protein